MTKKVHVLGISPCYTENGKKTALHLFTDKTNRIETVFARKEDTGVLEWLKEQLAAVNKGIDIEQSGKVTHINNAMIFYDSKIGFIFDYIKENIGKKNILVLANGDPNFFGIGAGILNELKANEKKFIEIYPSFSFMQIGFSKLKISMTDSCIVSLHGRSLRNLYDALYSQKDSIGIYTDDINTPYRIYTELEEKGFIGEFNFYVLADLCSKNEKIYKSFTREIFDSLSDKKNIVIIEKKRMVKAKKSSEVNFKSRFNGRSQNKKRNTKQNRIFGIEDEEYFCLAGEPTKKEVRAISMSLMNLQKDSVIIDAGCGSGSISIEASAISDGGIVYAVDKNEAKIENLKKNIKKFQRPNIVPILGKLPEALNMFKKTNNTDIASPDAVFIGGGSNDLEKILAESFRILNNDGVIVVNSILLSSFNNILSYIDKFNLGNKSKIKIKYDVIAVNIARLKTINESDSYFHPLNQIYITRLVKCSKRYNNKYSKTGFKFENKDIKSLSADSVGTGRGDSHRQA